MLGKFDFMPLKKVFHGLKPKVSYRETKVSALGNCSFNTEKLWFQALKQIVLAWGTTCLKAED